NPSHPGAAVCGAARSWSRARRAALALTTTTLWNADSAGRAAAARGWMAITGRAWTRHPRPSSRAVKASSSRLARTTRAARPASGRWSGPRVATLAPVDVRENLPGTEAQQGLRHGHAQGLGVGGRGAILGPQDAGAIHRPHQAPQVQLPAVVELREAGDGHLAATLQAAVQGPLGSHRSEERRVGQEGGSRWSPDHGKLRRLDARGRAQQGGHRHTVS